MTWMTAAWTIQFTHGADFFSGSFWMQWETSSRDKNEYDEAFQDQTFFTQIEHNDTGKDFELREDEKQRNCVELDF